MRPLRLAPRLRPGDTVGLISPASPPRPGLVDSGTKRLHDLGYSVRMGKHALNQTGYLAGSDAQRARDLQEMFSRNNVRAVFCTRGGYGVSRMLSQLDLKKLRSQFKIVVGYSDLTILHLALQKAGCVSFWGPMPASSTGLSPFSLLWLEKAVGHPEPLGMLPKSDACVVRGDVMGQLTGGTLSLLAASLGTGYELETKNRIVFLEDVGEEPYRIDRMLTQLLDAGKLKDAAGIVLGIFRSCEADPGRKKPGFTLQEVLWERLKPLGVPMIAGFPVGHIADQVTLPYGVRARLNAKNRTLEILDPAVK